MFVINVLYCSFNVNVEMSIGRHGHDAHSQLSIKVYMFHMLIHVIDAYKPQVGDFL